MRESWRLRAQDRGEVMRETQERLRQALSDVWEIGGPNYMHPFAARSDDQTWVVGVELDAFIRDDEIEGLGDEWLKDVVRTRLLQRLEDMMRCLEALGV